MTAGFSVHLEPFGYDDIDRLITWLDSPEVFWYWTASHLNYPLTYEQYAPRIAESKAKPPLRYIFRAVESASNQVMGHIELSQLNPEAGTATLGRILIAPEWRGRGLGKPMVRAAIDKAFDELGFKHLDLQVAEDNLIARCCYESVGFVDDGPMWEDPKIRWMHLAAS
jgi:RimJ/RimL family protein N-acetyltransferase